jgi:hypothetical protein
MEEILPVQILLSKRIQVPLLYIKESSFLLLVGCLTEGRRAHSLQIA